MNRILQLKQDRGRIAEEAKQLNAKAEQEKRLLTTEEQERFDKILTDIKSINATIRALEQEVELDAAIENTRSQRQADSGTDPDQHRDAFRTFLRVGPMNMEPNQRQLLVRASQTSNDFQTTIHRAGNPQSVINTGLGGYLVPQGFWAQVIEALKFFGGMEEVSNIISTASGNDLPIPTDNDTGNVGQILGENSPETAVELTFGQVVMKAFKYSSRMILVPIELLQDSGVDVEAHIVKKLAERLGRIQNTHFTVGTGSGQPRGVTIDAVSGKVGTTGQTTSVIYNDLIDLKYSVNKAYRSNASWMMADSTLTAILKLVDDNHRPLILDYIRTLQAGEPDTLLGQRIIVNDDIAAMGANAKSILYGDFKNYWIRRVMAMMMMRLDERYAEAGQVAFLAFMRSDGRMVDAGTHPIKYYANSAS